jgi:sugar O-acyltransferase (sialic acid O-acetyltransferase NeuD family)
MKTKLCIYGAGGFGKEIYYLLKHSYDDLIEVISYIDDNNDSSELFGLPIVRNGNSEEKIVIAIADSISRKKIALQNLSKVFKGIVKHQNVNINHTVSIDIGTIICEGVRFTVLTNVGRFVIINLNSTIGHDCVIEDFVSIMPGVHLSGNVSVGEGTFIGSGAVVLQNIKIGKWCRIGAGAVVTRDIPDGKTFFGVPAKEKI